MKKKLEKNDLEYQLFQDMYSLTQDFYVPESNEIYFDCFVKRCEEFTKRYIDTPYERTARNFAQDLTERITHDIECPKSKAN